MLCTNELLIGELFRDGENLEANVKEIIKRYVNLSISNARSIMDYSIKVSDQIVEHLQSDISLCKSAIHMCMFQQCLPDMDKTTLFSSMLPVCMSTFPNGYPDNGSKAEKEYFEKFVSLLQSKNEEGELVFDFKDEGDLRWADSFGYTDYLKFIYERYVDKR